MVELAQERASRGGHEEQNVYTSCRLLLCTRRNYTPPHPLTTKRPSAKSSGHNGYEFPFLFKQDDVSECIQMLQNTVDPLWGPGGKAYFRPSREVGYPFKYRESVYVTKPPNYSTADDKIFPLFTDRSRAQRINSFKGELKKEKLGSNEGETQKRDRIAKIFESLEAQLKEHGTPKGDALKSGPDAYTGLLTQMPSNPFGPSPEAMAPAAFFRNLLAYHAPAAVVIIFSFLNDAKGREFFAADIALSAEWKRVLNDSTMPWDECCKRLRWLGIAMDNLAIARQLMGFTKTHQVRHEEWEGLDKKDLKMLLDTALTGRNTRLLQEKIRKAKQDGRQILSLAVYSIRTRIPVQDSDKQQIQANCLDIAKHYRLSEEEFKAYLCLGDEICPFHVLSHEELRKRRYDIQMLRAILQDSDFHTDCNKAARSLGIHELDIDNHWDRLLHAIVHEMCQLVVKATAEVKQRRPSLKQGSRDFIEEVKWRTVDHSGFPFVPFQSHGFGYVLAKRGAPNTAMFTGLQGRLFTVGEALHDDSYHHVRSYDDDRRSLSVQARITNEIQKSTHPTLWELLFQIHMMVPVDGAYWKIDRALGDRRFDRDDSHDTTPPGPSYGNLELDEPPIDQLLSGQEGPLTFSCPDKGCNVEGVHAGEYQLHLNQDHSTWAQHCGKCGRHFPNLLTMEAHKTLNSCLADDTVDDAVNFFKEHLSCRADGCAKEFNNAAHLSSHEDTHKAVEEQKIPRFRCDCGRYWSDFLYEMRPHQKSKNHKDAIAAKGKGNSMTLWKGPGISADTRKRFEFYSGLEQSLFQTVTEDQISQQGSSSGKGDKKKYEGWLELRQRSVNNTIRDRKPEKGKGKYHCERCRLSLATKQHWDRHLVGRDHKIAMGTFTFADWQQAVDKRRQKRQATENAAAAADLLGAAIKKLKDDVLERFQKLPADTEGDTKGQHICDVCLQSSGTKQHLTRHQQTAKYCQKTRAILESLDSDIKVAQGMIRERLANPTTQAPHTQPQSSSSADANDAGDGGSGPGPSTVATRKRRQREEDAGPAGRPSKRQRSVQVSAGDSPRLMAGGNGDGGGADAMDVDSGGGSRNDSASSFTSVLSFRTRQSVEGDSGQMDFEDGDRKGKGKARD